MVSRINRSAYAGEPPQGDNCTRDLGTTPLYDKQLIKQIVSRGSNHVVVATDKCQKDTQLLMIDHDDLPDFITKAVYKGSYKNSKWCAGSEAGAEFACDAYIYSKDEWNEYTASYLETKYYVKLAIGASGNIIALISLHLSS